MSKRRRRRQRGKRKELARKLRAQELATWHTLNDSPQKRLARAKKKAAKMVRNMAKQIVGVQPMSAPAGEIFKIKVRYEDGREQEDN